MAERFALAYYYVTHEDKARLDSFKAISGDSEKYLVTQFVRGWIGRNREYYLDIARQDAKSREMELSEWANIVITQGIDQLPDYKEELSDVPPSLLRHVVVPPSAIKRPINYIALGKQNVILLKVGVYYDRDSTIGFVSRIVRENLTRNWEKLYKSQVEAEDLNTWR